MSHDYISKKKKNLQQGISSFEVRARNKKKRRKKVQI